MTAGPAQTNSARLLLLSPTRRDGEASQKIFAQAGIVCELCADLIALCEKIDVSAGAAIVPEEVIVADTENLLAHCLVKQPVWSDIPIIVLSRGGVESPGVTKALATIGNVSVVERPTRVSTMISQVRTALRARTRQYEVRDYLAAKAIAEEQLQAERTRLRLAIAAADMGAWEANHPNGEITFSPRCRDHFGFLPDAVPTRAQVWQAIYPDDRSRIADAVAITRATGQTYESEYRVVWPDGSIRWLLAFGRWLNDGDASAPNLIGVTLDVTERKRLEEERDELLQREQQASRAKDRFLAVLSHELRTPLSPVVMTLAAMQENPALPSELGADLRMVRRNIDLETKLIDDLLDLSRVATGKLPLTQQPVNMHDVLGHVIANCNNDSTGKRVTLHADLRAERFFATADPARVQQVFWNLLRNAMKFTPAGGTVIVASCNTPDGKLRVEIRDTGIGIPADMLPRIFDAFEQGDPNVTRQFGGLGLGLAISKALIDLHGGSIRATSDGPGKGSTFIIEMDALASVPAATTLAPRLDSKDGPQKLQLLLVEDHIDTATVLSRLLGLMGYGVVMAHDVATALKLADSQRFDLVVSDLGLPDASGFELMTRLKARHGLLGIALSGYGMEEDMRRSRACGFVDHVVKPVDAQRLAAVIRRVTTPPTAN